MTVAVLLVMEPEVAVTLTVTAAATVCAVARPLVLMARAAVFDEAHVTWLVKSLVLPSPKVPVAVNCCVPPELRVAEVGLIAIEASAVAVTVMVEVDVKLPEVAVMVALPAFTPVTRPAVDTVAMVLSELDQVTEFVLSSVLLSSKVPVAVSCWVAPTEMVAEFGATAMEVSVASTKKPHPASPISNTIATAQRVITPVFTGCRALLYSKLPIIRPLPA